MGIHSRRVVFADLVQNATVESAANAWDRARRASALRHALLDAGRHAAAARLAALKLRALCRVLRVAPWLFVVLPGGQLGSGRALVLVRSLLDGAGLHAPAWRVGHITRGIRA